MSTSDDGRYPKVFSPLKLGPVEISNRIYIPPHGIPLEAPVDGAGAHLAPSAEVPAYFGERAAGGCALIFHSTQVGPSARHGFVKHTPWFDANLPSYVKVAESVHEQGSKIMAEIWHASFFHGSWEVLGPRAPQLGASPTAFFAEAAGLYEMEKEDIEQLVAAHAKTTRNLREAGYDGVEVHASHATAINYFLSPSFNRRTDEYGGSIENRARLLRECVEASRSEAGSTMAVGIRISADELLENGTTTEETTEIIQHLQSFDLLDYVDLDCSIEPEQNHLMTTSYFEPKFHNAERVAKVSKALDSLPVLTSPGRVTSLEDAESLLSAGVADMIGAVRGQIAEPNMVRYGKEGREDEARTCIAVNHCIEAGSFGGFGCAINPEAGKELRWGRLTRMPAPRTMKVVVVGGGPAGAEAGRVAAERGHDVVLFEERDQLGGNLELWSRLPGRGQVAKQIEWWRRRLERQEVDVRLGTAATHDGVLAEKPEVVMLATGSRYQSNGDNGFNRRPIPGSDRELVIAADEVLESGEWPQGKVVIVDDEGFHAGVGIAEAVAEHGGEAHLITRKAMVGDQLVGSQSVPYVMQRLSAAGVKVSVLTFVSEIRDGAVDVFDVVSGARHEIDGVDRVVMATMRAPVRPLASLRGSVPYLYTVGDALAVRGLREATYEGYRFSRVIGEKDMPRRVTDVLFEGREGLRPAADDPAGALVS